jgi:YVTN family beta-propeller protein
MLPWILALLSAVAPPSVHAQPIQASPVLVQIDARASLRLRCSVDRRPAKPCAHSATFRLPAGRHTVTVVAVDAQGRRSAPRSATVVVPSPAPRPVHVGGAPVGIGVLDGALWVASYSDGVLSRVDTATRAVTATVHVGGQLGSVGADASGVWVSVFDGGAVARIDPDRRTVVGRVAVGGRPSGIAFANGAVWVGNLDGWLSRIDPATMKATKIAMPSGVSSPMLARGRLWVGLQDGTVAIVDPAAGTVAGRTAKVDVDVDALADTPAGIWVSTFGGSVGRIDPATGRVSLRRRLGGRGGGIAFAGGSVWASDYDGAYVVRIDPRTGAFLSATATGRQPRESLPVGSTLWVLDQADGAVSPVPLR